MITNDQGIVNFRVSSGFGHRTQAPFVQVLIEAADFMTQMSPGDARALAMNLLNAADAAESDGFLISFMREKIGAADYQIAGVLEDFRKWREKAGER
jgi:hypothetical protein